MKTTILVGPQKGPPFGLALCGLARLELALRSDVCPCRGNKKKRRVPSSELSGMGQDIGMTFRVLGMKPRFSERKPPVGWFIGVIPSFHAEAQQEKGPPN